MKSPAATSKPRKKKRSHGPSAYNLFVKKNYDSVRTIKRPQDRLKELGKMWRAHKASRTKASAPPPTGGD